MKTQKQLACVLVGLNLKQNRWVPLNYSFTVTFLGQLSCVYGSEFDEQETSLQGVFWKRLPDRIPKQLEYHETLAYGFGALFFLEDLVNILMEM